MTDQQPVPPATGEPPSSRPRGRVLGESARWAATFREITTGTFGVTVLAFVLALIIGGLLIIVTDPDVTAAASYLFAKPLDFFQAAWSAVSDAYAAMFRGAVFNYDAPTFARGIRSLTETMTVATPLIIAALGVAVGFRAGLFNIGAQGQVLMGAAIGGYVGFAWSLPPVLHLLLALLGGILAGGFWAGIAGFLKPARGPRGDRHDHAELRRALPGRLVPHDERLHPAGLQPAQEPGVKDTAQLPLLLGDQFRLNAGFLVAILAAVFVWWLMTRSTWGFRFRAVGSNPQAARTAGMGVASSFVLVMVVSGALAAWRAPCRSSAPRGRSPVVSPGRSASTRSRSPSWAGPSRSASSSQACCTRVSTWVGARWRPRPVRRSTSSWSSSRSSCSSSRPRRSSVRSSGYPPRTPSS
ncbi:ABC transporter permease [Oerskovia sp. M15]